MIDEILLPQRLDVLKTLRSMSGNYGWLLRLLRRRQERSGHFPNRLHKILLRCVPKRRPYFIGETRHGVRFLGDIREYDSVHWAVGAQSDERLIDLACEQLNARPGAYLDVGANCGVVAATVALRCPAVRGIVAFEPVPATAARCAATFALNGLDRARLFQVAVGETDGEIVIYEKPGHSGGASALPNRDTSAARVPCCTLDTLRPRLEVGRVSLIKVDVEGFEPQVLRGAARWLASDRPVVLYEYNERALQAGWSIETMNNLLRAAGRYDFTGLRADGARLPILSGLGNAASNHLDVLCVPV